jgi:hypothetical protein
LPLVSRVELSESREGTFLPLKDGSFIHLAGDHWERFFAQGKRFQLPSPQRHAAPFRVLRAARIDEFFVLYEDGLVERLQLQDRLRVVWSLRLPELPLDIASAGNTLVTLRATRDGSSTSWLLEVVGQNAPKPELIDLGVSAPDSFHDDWVARQLRSHGLTASERWIAVGGGSRLRVWQLKGLELVLDTRLSGRATAASP